MIPIERYYTMVVIDPAERGKGYKVKKIPQAENFFYEIYPQFLGNNELSKQQDFWIQSNLVSEIANQLNSRNNFRQAFFNLEPSICLRCYSSHFITFACQNWIESLTWYGYRFQLIDFLALVLTDDGQCGFSNCSDAQLFVPYSFDILKDYLKRKREARKSLGGWTILKTKQSDSIEKFLLERGICTDSNWSLLNSTTSVQFAKILNNSYFCSPITRQHRSATEIQQRASAILQSYHRIYRGDRRRNRQYGRCTPPNSSQLERMIDDLREQDRLDLTPQQLMQELQAMAQCVREDRIYRENPILRSESIDAVNPITGREKSEEIADPKAINAEDISSLETQQKKELQWEELKEFLREQIVTCLDWGIERGFGDLPNFLSRRCAHLAGKIEPAFRLLYCENRAQSEVADRLGIAQSQVSRQIKPLAPKLFDRVRQRTQEKLIQHLLNRVKGWAIVENPEQRDYFDNLVEQVEQFLRQSVFLDGEANLRDVRTRTTNSLYVQRLCLYLDRNWERQDYEE